MVKRVREAGLLGELSAEFAGTLILILFGVGVVAQVVASFITGYHHAWRDQWGNLYWWVPIAGPLIGGLVGAVAYKLFIGRFLPTAEPEPPGRVPAPEA